MKAHDDTVSDGSVIYLTVAAERRRLLLLEAKRRHPSGSDRQGGPSGSGSRLTT